MTLAIAASIINYTINLIIQVISTIGYPGIFFLMMLEGMLLPIPSEVVMAFGGFLIATHSAALPAFMGIPAFVILLIVGSIGNLVGALIAYLIGDYGGIPLINRYGKYVLLKEDTVAKTQLWFEKYGSISVFLTRLVPVFRTFISIPAGIARMNRKVFSAFTLIGALIWDTMLIFLGMEFGANWKSVVSYFDKYTYVALGAIAVLFVYWLYRGLSTRNNKAGKEKNH